MMTSKEELLLKSLFLKEQVKYFESIIKEENRKLESLKNDYTYWNYDTKDEQIREQEARISGMVNLKVRTEKYSKKLKHEADELDSKTE